MWYHYLFIVAGLYMVGSAIYNIMTGSRSMTSLMMNGVEVAMGAAIGYYGYSGVTAPAPMLSLPPAVSTMVGGAIRKLFR